MFPLQKGDERIGLVELYDFNYKTQVTPEQIVLLRTIGDKASYSIENARLLQLTQQRLNEKTAMLNEKEVLLKEIHHWVKNNLQVISSLLSLQSAQISDPQTQNVLRESQNRVRTMALIHEKLYQSTDLAQVDFAPYLRSLVNSLAQSYREKSDRVAIRVDSQSIILDIDTAIACGLIVNELVSNALKHAFPAERPGEIRVVVAQHGDDRVLLQVSDDGAGLPPHVDFRSSPSLGLQLINSLVDQINGSIEVETGAGTHFAIAFIPPATGV